MQQTNRFDMVDSTRPSGPGICDTHEEVESGAKQTSILSIVSGNRAKRQARTA